MSVFRAPMRDPFGPVMRGPFEGFGTDLRAAVIAALFGDGEQGAAQFSDLNTLFLREALSDTLITGPSKLNDPVGFRAELGAGGEGVELIASGSASSWGTARGATVTDAGAHVRIEGNGSTTLGIATLAIPTVVGNYYVARFNLISQVDSQRRVRITNSATDFNSAVRNILNSSSAPLGQGGAPFKATATTSYFMVVLDSATDIVEIGDISVRELPGNHATQTSSSLRPAVTGSPPRIDYDGVDDELVTTFPASLGSNVTVARSIPGTGASILTGQTVGDTFTDNVDNHALIIVDRALTGAETDQLTDLLNKEAGL